MATFIVNEKNTSEIEAGFYSAKFTELSGPHKSDKEDKPDYFKFVFENDERVYVGYGDVSKMGPRAQNRLGRFLLGLAGKPIKTTDRTAVETDQYIGKEYVLIYGPSSVGNIKMLSFSPAAAE